MMIRTVLFLMGWFCLNHIAIFTLIVYEKSWRGMVMCSVAVEICVLSGFDFCIDMMSSALVRESKRLTIG